MQMLHLPHKKFMEANDLLAHSILFRPSGMPS